VSEPTVVKNTTAPPNSQRWLSWLAWILAIAAVVLAGYLGWRSFIAPLTSRTPIQLSTQPTPIETSPSEITPDTLPEWQASNDFLAVYRLTSLHTIIPTRPRQDIITYTVDTGDAIFGIASTFGVKPDTILWANYNLLNDNPDLISIGMDLIVPPTNGVLYKWQEGDTLQSVADTFDAKVDDILSWSGNKIDLTNPTISPGILVMVPGGHREFRQWLIPTIPRGQAGVLSSVLGPGACDGGYEGAYGTGAFVWPADNHKLSGNDYWSGHLGIDIAAGEGALIYAADSGVIVFAGGAYGGYGNMIMIDHGNGYQTLYAHLSVIYVHCGQSVSRGQTIGIAGSTGNSTGPHLHFEVRYLGGFIDPWYVLPAP